MTQQEILDKVGEIISTNFKHDHYHENVELYKTYLALSTGEGIDEYLKRFSSRETEEGFNERKAVTVDICKAVVKNLCHVFYRVTWLQGVRVDIDIDDSKEDDYADILASYGRWGMAGYMEKRMSDFVKIDPNGWLVVDFESIDGKDYARPYPVEYYSPDVIDYQYTLNILDYFCGKKDRMATNYEGEVVEVEDFYIYSKEGAVVFKRRPEIEMAQPFREGAGYSNGDLVSFNEREVEYKDTDGKWKTKSVADVYEIIIPLPYNLEETPCKPVGYLTDELTRGETFINFFDNAVPFLEKLIKINSESDISACKHAFPQKIQFVRPCPNECEETSTGVFCKDGVACGTCNGHGYIDAHRSGLDVVYLPLTEDSKDLNLDNIVKYVAVPIDTLKYQDERIQELIEMCKRVIYNTDIFSKQEISETATAKLIEFENMLDTIYTYAVHYGDMYEWQLNMISQITDIEAEPNVVVSKDLKLLTKAQLIGMLQAAITAGANPAVINAINDELVYAFYGNTTKYKNYLDAKRLIPFQDKTPQQQTLMLSTLDKADPYRIRFVFGSEILRQLESEHPDFHLFNDELKDEKFMEKVNEIAETMTIQPVDMFQEQPTIGDGGGIGGGDEAVKDIPPEILKDLTADERRELIGFSSAAKDDTETDKILLIEKIGVGGSQAFVNIITNPQLSEDQKVTALQLLFGIDEAQARALSTSIVPPPIKETKDEDDE